MAHVVLDVAFVLKPIRSTRPRLANPRGGALDRNVSTTAVMSSWVVCHDDPVASFENEDLGQTAPVIADPTVRWGVVYDVDGILRAGALRHPVLATRALLDRSSRDRRSVLGMAGVLHALTSAHPDTQRST